MSITFTSGFSKPSGILDSKPSGAPNRHYGYGWELHRRPHLAKLGWHRVFLLYNRQPRNQRRRTIYKSCIMASNFHQKLNKELTKQERQYLLKLISDTKFEGKEVYIVHSIVEKLTEKEPQNSNS